MTRKEEYETPLGRSEKLKLVVCLKLLINVQLLSARITTLDKTETFKTFQTQILNVRWLEKSSSALLELGSTKLLIVRSNKYLYKLIIITYTYSSNLYQSVSIYAIESQIPFD